MDTLTKSCSPTIVITANGEVQTHEEAIVYVKELEIFLTMKVLENTPAVLSLGKFCDENGYLYEWINGQKPHLIKDGIRIICNTENLVPIVVPGLTSSSSTSSSSFRTPMRQESHCSSSSSSSLSSPSVGEMSVREREDALNSDISPVPVPELVDDRTENLWKPKPTKHRNLKKRPRLNGETCVTILNGCKNLGRIWWMMKFQYTETHASSSHEASLEPTFKKREDLGNHDVHTHFPKDRNCEICKRTKITRAPCRRRNGGAVLRAENFGDLIIADHKVLSDNCESRNNHRCAVVVQDLATQWIQAYPSKTKTSQKTQRKESQTLGLTIVGKHPWQQEEEQKGHSSIAIMIQEQFYIPEFNGHSGRNFFDLSLQDNVIIQSGFFQYIYQIGCAFSLHSIISSGLIFGGQNLSNRRTVFLLPIDLRDKNHKDPEKIDLNVPCRGLYLLEAWKKHQDAVYWLAIRKGLTFYQARSNAIVLQGTLPAHCNPKVVRLKTGEVLNEKLTCHLYLHQRSQHVTNGQRN